MNASPADIIIGTIAGSVLVGSWVFVLYRRSVLLRRYNDRRAWAAFLLSAVLVFAACLFALEQLVSIMVDTDKSGREFQSFLIGMGIGSLMVGGVLETSYMWRGRRDP